MRFLLDTDSVIFLMNDPLTGAVARRVSHHAVEDLATSAIALSELMSGAHRGAPQRLQRNLQRLAALRIAILPFDDRDAAEAGRIDAMLKKAGQPISPLDVLIAGQALARKLTVVTNNTREFQRVEGLDVVDWSR